MKKSFPVGVAQAKVLKALDLEAKDWDEAQAIFERLGLAVGTTRVGRTTEPTIRVLDRYAGAFNEFGEGESWRQYDDVDLTPIQQWIVK